MSPALPNSVAANVEQALGRAPLTGQALGGGCIGQVFRLDMPDGEQLVAKVAAPGQRQDFKLEGWMLDYLAAKSALPVPAVRYAGRELLVLDYILSPDSLTAAAEQHGAGLVAALHDITGDAFGLERDTVIGGLHQPNCLTESWLSFFRDQRLLFMGNEAMNAGRLAPGLMHRLEAFAGRLDRFIDKPPRPILLHGDLWTGNILVNQSQVVGFIDPAIYYGDAEMDLAFSTLFGTFNRPFFDRYNEISPIRPGFFEVRRDIYNLYPLLVHVRLFGGTYSASVEAILHRFGF